MNAIIYLLQVSACTGIFYTFYYFMLRRLTFFTVNRWYLVITLALSFIIPLLTISINKDTAPVIQQVVHINQLQSLPVNQVRFISNNDAKPTFNRYGVLETLYVSAAGILLIRLLTILAVFFIKIKGKQRTQIDNTQIIHGDKKLDNGSFFNYIILNDEGLSETEIRQIIAHELIHVKRLHSVDRMLASLVQVVLWFNPFVYLYSRAIEQNHEFEVDREMGLQADKGIYADMLLHLSVARGGLIYNSFSKVPLKRRITMLFTKPTNHVKKVIYLLTIPVVMISCLAFARIKTRATGYTKNNRNDFVIVAKDRQPLVNPAPNAKGQKTDYATKENDHSITDVESKMIEKALAKANRPFFERFHFKRAEGNEFDVIAFNTKIIGKTHGIMETFDTDAKIGAFIDGKFFSEEEMNNLAPEKSAILYLDMKPDYSKLKLPDNYAFSFSFKTKDTYAPVDSVKRNQKTDKPTRKINSVGAIGPLSTKKIPLDSAEKINYQNITPAEEQMMNKTLANGHAPFFSRFHFIRPQGHSFDQIVFMVGNIGGTANLGADDKAAAFIDGKFYNEDALKKISPDRAAQLEYDNGSDHSKREKIPDDANYAMPFNFKTRTTSAPVVKSDDKVGSVNQKTNVSKKIVSKPTVIEPNSITDDKALVTKEQDALSKKILHDVKAPFFSRFHFTPAGSKRFDIAMFKLNANTVVSSDLGVNDKVGIWIDGKFYNEDAIKILTPEKIATLTIDDNPNPDPSKFEKVENGAHNSLPISLKTKSI